MRFSSAVESWVTVWTDALSPEVVSDGICTRLCGADSFDSFGDDVSVWATDWTAVSVECDS